MNAPLPSPTIKTATGLYFPLLAPSPEFIRIEDIAHALSNLCRFTGHVRHFYSVAQHSYLASHLVPPEDALVALLHDASEAYIADISRPLKPYLTNYAEIETRIMEAVLKAFGLPTAMPPSVKRADLILLASEKRDLMLPDVPGDEDWDCISGIEPTPARITPWAPSAAKFLFLDRFAEITGGRRS